MARGKAGKIDAATIVADLRPYDLTETQFESIATTVYETAGINLRAGKEELVKSRLVKRLRALDLPDFGAYLDYLKADISGQEIVTMLDLLTTNKTSFFREQRHFDFLRQWLDANADLKKMRIWSAGCSSGEEPFSIAIVLCQEMKDIGQRDVRVLATDISGRMLERARRGVYPYEPTLRGLPSIVVNEYFTSVGTQRAGTYVVAEPVKSLVRFAQFNLMGLWPMRGPFDLIFCRNVMIYFDGPTRQRVLSGFRQVLRAGGYLLVGHSESLLRSSPGFRYIQPAVYMRDDSKCSK